LLRFVAGHCTDHRVLITGDPVGGAFDVSLRLGSVILCFALCVFLATSFLPRFGASYVANLSWNETALTNWRKVNVPSRRRIPSQSGTGHRPCCVGSQLMKRA
jgi:hypothetical protein